MATSSDKKLELPVFLKVLSSGEMSMTKAIAFATKVSVKDRKLSCKSDMNTD